MCDRIEIGVDGASVWSISKDGILDLCLCVNEEEEIYKWCLAWVQSNIPAPQIDERIVIERARWKWRIYKEKVIGEEWQAVRFADEGENVPKTELGKKLRAARNQLVPADFLENHWREIYE